MLHAAVALAGDELNGTTANPLKAIIGGVFRGGHRRGSLIPSPSEGNPRIRIEPIDHLVQKALRGIK